MDKLTKNDEKSLQYDNVKKMRNSEFLQFYIVSPIFGIVTCGTFENILLKQYHLIRIKDKY